MSKMPDKTTINPPLDGGRSAPFQHKLVLASSSIYRKELLARLGMPFVAESPDISEASLPGETPSATALRLSEAKARSVAARHPGALIIGSDQVADCEGVLIGKPVSHEDAVAQLTLLSGRNVIFHTGIALLDTDRNWCQADLVSVTSVFRDLSAAEIETYLQREQPYGCAGSVKVEGLGIALFTRIASDDPTALVGLPLIRLTDMLRAAGVAVLTPVH